MIRALPVNSQRRVRSEIIVFMDDDTTNWRAVKAKLEEMGRGAQAELGRRLKMDPAQLNRTLKSNGEPKVSQNQVIERFFDEASSTEGLAITSERQTFAAPAGRQTPVYGYAAASDGPDGRIAFNSGDVLEWIELPAGMQPPGDVFVARAIGSSMYPRIFDGEMLVVRRAVPPRRDKEAIFEFKDGTAVVKTYKGARDGRLFGQQYNPEKLLDWPADEIKAVHDVWAKL